MNGGLRTITRRAPVLPDAHLYVRSATAAYPRPPYQLM